MPITEIDDGRRHFISIMRGCAGDSLATLRGVYFSAERASAPRHVIIDTIIECSIIVAYLFHHHLLAAHDLPLLEMAA